MRSRTSDHRDLAIRGLLPAARPAGPACSTNAPMRNTRTSSRGSILPTSCDMRAPGAATGVYALECAMDELAVALKLDPLELRLRCYSDRDQNEDLPYSSKAAARMLPPGRGGVRLGQAQPRAALDARRQRSGRLGHGDGRLGGAAGADHGPHRAHRQRPRRGRVRDLRHRHRHLHDHGAGRGRHARPAARQHQRQARRFDAAAIAGRRRIVDCGLGVATRSRRRPARSATSCCAWPSRCRIRRSPSADAGRRRARRRQARRASATPARARVDRRCHAAWQRGPHRAGEDHQLRRRQHARATTRIRRSSPR